MSDVFLTAEDVERLTGKRGGTVRRWNVQVRELIALGYREKQHFIVAATGEPLVTRASLDAEGRPAQRRGHRWHMIGGVRNIGP